MKPLNKLERQYIAYWVMNIVAPCIHGVTDDWGMDCPSTEKGRLANTKDAIIKLGGFERLLEREFDETTE